MDIEISNFFTPNGDVMNDTWNIQNAEYFPDLTVKIYDRYGREVAVLSNVEGWDGIGMLFNLMRKSINGNSWDILPYIDDNLKQI